MIKYRDDMTAAETAAMMAEIDALDEAYAQAEAFHLKQFALWLEWANMTAGAAEWEEDPYREMRKAGLNHRGLP